MTESRYEQACVAAAELLTKLESSSITSEQLLLGAKRVARLLRDQDAQLWLDRELRGYMKDDPALSGKSLSYVRAPGRCRGSRFVTASLPALESEVASRQTQLGRISPPPTIPADQNGLARMEDRASVLQDEIAVRQSIVSAVRGAVHSSLADTHVALSYGSIVEPLFQKAREAADRFIAQHCARATEQLLSAEERLREQKEESYSQALLSCRRTLLSLADSVFPPRSTAYVGADGTPRDVGPDNYKNRLLAFVTDELRRGTRIVLIAAELEHLASRLDAVYEQDCKGVHSDVTVDEARLALIHTYLFIAEIAAIVGAGETQ
jgi:hypothetical protein